MGKVEQTGGESSTRPFLLPDWSVIVKMKKISYGYVEAAYYWYQDLSDTFFYAGYNQLKKDKWVFMKKEGDNVAYYGTTVDDCLFVTTDDEIWIQRQV